MTERRRTLLLAGSLLLNAILAGFILGQLRGEAFARSTARHLQEMSANIPPAVETVIASAFETERLPLSEAMRATRAAQDESAAIVRRDPLDLDALDAALTRIRAGQDATLVSLHRAMRSAGAKLDPQGREMVAQLLENAPPAGPAFTARYRWNFLRGLL